MNLWSPRFSMVSIAQEVLITYLWQNASEFSSIENPDTLRPCSIGFVSVIIRRLVCVDKKSLNSLHRFFILYPSFLYLLCFPGLEFPNRPQSKTNFTPFLMDPLLLMGF